MNNKLLTICIPTYNRKRFVCDLVSSIIDFGLLSKVDLIVIDDGSSDGTFSELEKIKCCGNENPHYIYQENKGFINTAISFFYLCKTEYLMLADDDMIITKGIFDLIVFLDKQGPDFVSPIFSATDSLSIFRGRRKTEKMHIQDFHSATDHGPGLVYRVKAFQTAVGEINERIKTGCLASEFYFLGALLLFLFVKSDNFWWYGISTCGFRKTGAEPSGIRDASGRKYTFIIPRWERHKALADLYLYLIKKAPNKDKKNTYKRLLIMHNISIYACFREGLISEAPKLLSLFDGGSVFYDLRHFYSRAKAFLSYFKARWL
ncbi:MAG: hypothetical protein ACD_29C00462G0003 [uncultured bacterium]|nr:MAG: hypothetical protein ACD_29C00462G0003 [uncultured bacterium]